VQVQIELFCKLHNINVKDDMPSEKSRKATLKRKIDRRGYVKHSNEVKKQIKTEKVAKVIEPMYSNITSEVSELTSPISEE
jgi:hypothetical protein